MITPPPPEAFEILTVAPSLHLAPLSRRHPRDFNRSGLSVHSSAAELEFVSSQTIDHRPITRQMTVNYPLH